MNSQTLTHQSLMKEKLRIKTLQVLNLLTFSGTIAVNFLAVSLPLGGKTTRQLSDQYPNLFTPAPVTFSIWGIIYIALLIFSLYQISTLFSKKERPVANMVADKTGNLFIFSNLLNMSWIIAWHYEFTLISVVIMIALLITLLQLNNKLGVGLNCLNRQEKYMAHLPFALYLGWISIATIANITALLVDIHWDGLGLSPVFWTVAMLLAGTFITLFVVLRTNSIFYGLVVIWAFTGIIIKRYASIDTEPYFIIPYTALLGIILILIAILVKVKTWLRY